MVSTKILTRYITDLVKIDTIIAFIVSYFLYYHFTNKPIQSLFFSILFVLIFLLILNIVRVML